MCSVECNKATSDNPNKSARSIFTPSPASAVKVMKSVPSVTVTADLDLRQITGWLLQDLDVNGQIDKTSCFILLLKQDK